MINILDFIIDAEENHGISFFVESGSLKFKSKNDAEPSIEYMNTVRSRKNEIIEFLKKDSTKSLNKTAFPKIQKNNTKYNPLSFSQERIWFIHKLEGSQAYHIPLLLRLKGNLDRNLLDTSFKKIIKRHEILRTVYFDENGIGHQKVLSDKNWKTIHLDLTKKSDEDKKKEVEKAVNTAFDLTKDYMIRVCLHKYADEDYLLIIVIHHIACDGESVSILMEEFSSTYFNTKENDLVSDLEIQYSDYAYWQKKNYTLDYLEDKILYWKNKLNGITDLQLPLDFARPIKKSQEGSTARHLIDYNISIRFKEFCREKGVTHFPVLLSILKVLLSRYTGQYDIAVGTPITNRNQKQVEKLVGFFTNTLVLRTQIEENNNFIELLSSVNENLVEAFHYQDVPFETIVKEVQNTIENYRTPLFQILFVLQEQESIPSDLFIKNGIELEEFYKDDEKSKFDITLTVSDTKDGLLLKVNYCTALFKEETILRLMHHYENLLIEVINDPKIIVKNLKLLSANEESQLFRTYGSSYVDFPSYMTILDYFQKAVKDNPGKNALIIDNTKITYSELDKYSNKLANLLINKGVVSNTFVGICMDRSIESIIGVLGIMKASGCFIPMDPKNPSERLLYMVRDTNLEYIITDPKSESLLPQVDNLVVIDNKFSLLKDYEESDVEIATKASDLIYLMYTSGSTGKPKGALINHSSMMDHLFGFLKFGPINECKTFMYFAPLSADAGYSILFSSFINSGTTFLISEEMLSNPVSISDFLKRNSVDLIKVVPSLWNYFLENEVFIKPEKVLIFGGEKLNPDILNYFRYDYDGLVFNHYGPTETTIGKLIYQVNLNTDYDNVPIGGPFSNTQVYIVDGMGRVCPIGVYGQLLIAGDGLASGYWEDEENTQKYFIDNYLEENKYSRLYKTGDKVRWLNDGNIEFVGRIDEQVKIQGHRVELPEIEAVLNSSDFVLQSAVITKSNSNEETKLIAFVKANEIFDRERIILHLKKYLPYYMIPNFIYELEKFPLMSNGKINKKLLPELNISQADDGFIAPSNEIEKVLSEIWKELLGLSQVSVNDHFFVIGGHSLLAAKVLSAVKEELSIELPLNAIFQYPTISSLADYINMTMSNYDELEIQ